MSCCVPGCFSLLQDGKTELPQDVGLLARWKAAIQAGTGQELPDEILQGGAMICKNHFEMDGTARYQEPTLFVLDNVLVEVSCCRMCFRFDTVHSMFNQNSFIGQGYTLRCLAYKYFRIPVKDDHAYKVLYCESCTVRLDTTHAFWKEIIFRSEEHKRLIHKMMRKKVEFSYLGSEEDAQLGLTNQSPSWENEDNAHENVEDTIVKEESKLNDSNSVLSGSEMDVKEEPPVFDDSYSGMIHMFEDSEENHEPDVNDEVAKPKKKKRRRLQVERENYPYHCKMCDKRYLTRGIFKRHEKVKCPALPFRCEVCDVGFKTPGRLSAHLKTGPKHRLIKQPERRRETRRFVPAIRHAAKDKPLRCRFCQKKFDLTKDIMAHFQKVHPEKNVTTFPCNECDEIFLHINDLSRHVVIHTDKFVCKLCGERQFSMKHLIMHRQTVHNLIFMGHLCHKCKNRFKNKTILKKHVKGCKAHLKQYQIIQASQETASSSIDPLEI